MSSIDPINYSVSILYVAYVTCLDSRSTQKQNSLIHQPTKMIPRLNDYEYIHVKLSFFHDLHSFFTHLQVCFVCFEVNMQKVHVTRPAAIGCNLNSPAKHDRKDDSCAYC